MSDHVSSPLPQAKYGHRWNGFVADPPAADKPVRGLHEVGNDKHRLRVEHNEDTLFVHLSGEDGPGWTTLVVDRASREYAVAQRRTQAEAARAAYELLYSAVRS